MRIETLLTSITLILGAAALGLAEDGPIDAVLGPADGAKRIAGLAFSASGSDIIAHYADGRILAWSFADKTERTIAQTENAFAYCAALDRLVLGTPTTAVLLSLTDGDYATLSEGFYDHAAFSRDCLTLVLSEAATRTVELWDLTGGATLSTAATVGAVRNGLHISPDGRTIAAATASLIGSNSEDTALEIFLRTDKADLQRTSLVVDESSALGLKAIALSGGMLITGTQSSGQAGLRAIAATDGATHWSWSNLDGGWITAIAEIEGRGLLITADDAGSVSLWHRATGARIGALKEPVPIDAMAVSADGRRAAVARRTGAIQVFSIDRLVDAIR